MKQLYWIALIIVALLIGGAIGASFFSKAPTATVTGATVSSVNLTSIGLTLTLAIDSPYPVTVPIKTLNYAVAYQGKGGSIPLASGEVKGIQIKPGNQELNIPVTVSNPSLIKSVLEVLKTGEISLMINGSFSPDFFGFAPAVPFSKDVTVTVPGVDVISTIGNLAGNLLQ